MRRSLSDANEKSLFQPGAGRNLTEPDSQRALRRAMFSIVGARFGGMWHRR